MDELLDRVAHTDGLFDNLADLASDRLSDRFQYHRRTGSKLTKSFASRVLRTFSDELLDSGDYTVVKPEGSDEETFTDVGRYIIRGKYTLRQLLGAKTLTSIDGRQVIVKQKGSGFTIGRANDTNVFTYKTLRGSPVYKKSRFHEYPVVRVRRLFGSGGQQQW